MIGDAEVPVPSLEMAYRAGARSARAGIHYNLNPWSELAERAERLEWSLGHNAQRVSEALSK